jgi:hypothetical protein
MTIQFGPKTYLVTGTPQHSQSGNAILTLPSYYNGGGTIRLLGVPGVGNNPQGTIANGPQGPPCYLEEDVLLAHLPDVIGGDVAERKASHHLRV